MYATNDITAARKFNSLVAPASLAELLFSFVFPIRVSEHCAQNTSNWQLDDDFLRGNRERFQFPYLKKVSTRRRQTQRW